MHEMILMTKQPSLIVTTRNLLNGVPVNVRNVLLLSPAAEYKWALFAASFL